MSATGDFGQVCRLDPFHSEVDGPDGIVYGFLDVADVEENGLAPLPRGQSRLERRMVFRLPTDDLGTIVRQSMMTVTASPTSACVGVNYTVKDIRLEGDGVVTCCYLVAT